MIISFSNLGGGGSYTLPTATATRLGGVKIGSGITVTNDGTISTEGGSYILPVATQNTLGGVMIGSGITVDSAGTISAQEYTLPTASSEVLGGIKVGSGLTITDGVLSASGGGADENAQHRLTASTKSDMEALTGVSEGDICVIPIHTEAMPPDYYDALNNYYGLESALYMAKSYAGVKNVRFTLVENPYYDGESQVNPLGYWYKEHFESPNWLYTGFGCDYGPVWYCYNDTTNTGQEDRTILSVGDHYDFNMSYLSNGGGSGNESQLVIYSNNTSFQYGLSAESLVLQETYQYNNGQWIQLANTEEVSSAMATAQNAMTIASNKLDAYGVNVDSWSNLEYYASFIGRVTVNEVDEGIRIHPYGANTKRMTPKIDEIVTSPSVGYMVALTQDQYDALVSGGTVDSQTFYIIIPDNS